MLDIIAERERDKKKSQNSEWESCARVHKHNRLNKDGTKNPIVLIVQGEKKAEKKVVCFYVAASEKKNRIACNVAQRNGKRREAVSNGVRHFFKATLIYTQPNVRVCIGWDECHSVVLVHNHMVDDDLDTRFFHLTWIYSNLNFCSFFFVLFFSTHFLCLLSRFWRKGMSTNFSAFYPANAYMCVNVSARSSIFSRRDACTITFGEVIRFD